jgi:misacylated tRNA(Ala) deacylase
MGNNLAKALYMDDSYLKEWDAEIKSISKDKFIVLDKTAFFPRGGGVEWDTGTITTEDGKEFNVVYTGKFSGEISHEVEKKGLRVGDKVHCKLNWERRYLLMRYHTATHVLSGVFYNEYDLKITGNQLTTEKGRIDLNLDKMDVDLIKKAIKTSNEIIKKELPVEIFYKSRVEAEKDSDLFKLAKEFPHDIDTFRIVDIKGFDRQADGGCHVKNLNEIGRIKFKDALSKGKNFKRVYFTIE